jgi:hypothetical protein
MQKEVRPQNQKEERLTMDKQQIDLRGNAQRNGSSFEPAVTSELSEEQLSNASGGKGGTKGGTKADKLEYLTVEMDEVLITNVSF